MSKAFDKLEKGSKEITYELYPKRWIKISKQWNIKIFSSIKEIVNNSKSISKVRRFYFRPKTFKDNSLSLTLGIEELNLESIISLKKVLL